MKHTILTFLTAFVLPMTANAQVSFGNPQLFNDAWLFTLTDDSLYCNTTFDDSSWLPVQLPHDWGITQQMSQQNGSCQGYLPGGVGWYRKHLLSSQLKELRLDSDRQFFLYFEGVYNRSTVYVNGHKVGYRPSGFSSFCYNITPFLNPDADNVIAVRVDHSRQNDSRWYTGSGIYRNVWLITAPEVHLEQWGSAWRLTAVDAQTATVEVDIETTHEPIANSTAPQNGYVANITIIDAQGNIVASSIGNPISSRQRLTTQLTVQQPQLWTLDSPYLYRIHTQLLSNGQIIDSCTVPLGLRTLTFDPNLGFALNGQWMKVKGVCLHDDAGVLGVAVPKAVWRRRLLTLKSLGVNAIRMSHNPHAPALYDLCDELGFLVMDEASDEWEFPKRKWLEGWNKGTPGFEGSYDYFNEWIDRDVADMVRRDRCHPSIFLWSIGNEVDYPNDPYSHPVLDGSTITQPMYGGYKPDQPNAERIGIIAQRLADIVRSIDNSRAVTGALAGVVMSNETAYPDAVDVVGYNYTESRYIEDHQRYPSRIIYGSENRHDREAWLAVRDNPHIFGQFLWTGIDYLGESGPWPARGSEAGLLDLAGHVKPQGRYRQMLWGEENADSLAQVFWNNRSRRGHRRQGREDRHETDFMSSVAAMRVSVDTLTLRTPDDVTHIDIELVDSLGAIISEASNDITCTVEGPIRLLGLENANIRDTTPATLNHRTAHRGRLLAYIARDFMQPLQQQATARVIFSSPEQKDVVVELTVIP
ncbi:MAG: glycoside hydrolase family 2 [Bacteroidaceae bacterium]|nr:glycoside hydrolase family 2 [Bacteroidaceae bacterium]